MNYKDQRKELGLAGSAAPLTSTQDGSKWHHGVDAVGIAKLTKISSDINDAFDKATRDFARTQINLGRLLNEARAIIPGDLQFGQWREKNTPITSRSTANKLMNLAKQVGDGRITQEMISELPLSTLKELISAPDSVLVHVRDKLREGETVTRSDVRQLGKEPAPEDDGEMEEAPHPDDPREVEFEPAEERQPKQQPKPANPKGPAAPAQPPVGNVIERLLALDTTERLRALDPKKGSPYPGCKPEEWAWMVLGLDPTPAYLPAPGVIHVLQDAIDDHASAAGITAAEAHTFSDMARRAAGLLNAE